MAEQDQQQTPEPGDARLYVTDPAMYQARSKQDWEREYCFAQNPGEDYFHMLMTGEIYIQAGDEKYCLACAARRGMVTTDRLNWQRAKQPRPGL